MGITNTQFCRKQIARNITGSRGDCRVILRAAVDEKCSQRDRNFSKRFSKKWRAKGWILQSYWGINQNNAEIMLCISFSVILYRRDRYSTISILIHTISYCLQFNIARMEIIVCKMGISSYNSGRSSNAPGVGALEKVVLEVGQGERPRQMTS